MKVAVLGSTGFLGEEILATLSRFSDFDVVALTGYRNHEKLKYQAARFAPQVVFSVHGFPGTATGRKPSYPHTRYCREIVELDDYLLGSEVEGVFFAASGVCFLETFKKLLSTKKKIWVASKEILVAAGEIFNKDIPLRDRPNLVPLDSEHNALWQMRRWIQENEIKRYFLTASGGPFYEWLGDLNEITPEMALAHPNWKMGAKITVDSAHLINKGLEVLEAHYFFGLGWNQLEVIVQRESIIHALVELRDGFVAALLSRPDMKSVILNAVFPERDRGNPFQGFRLEELKTLHFDFPVPEKFKGFHLALLAGKRGGGYPAFFCGACETCYQAFMQHQLLFGDMLHVLQDCMDQDVHPPGNTGDVLEVYRWGMQSAEKHIQQRSSSRC